MEFSAERQSDHTLLVGGHEQTFAWKKGGFSITADQSTAFLSFLLSFFTPPSTHQDIEVVVELVCSCVSVVAFQVGDERVRSNTSILAASIPVLAIQPFVKIVDDVSQWVVEANPGAVKNRYSCFSIKDNAHLSQRQIELLRVRVSEAMENVK